MFLRIDRLQIELPLPAEPAPNAAAALQELLGDKYGEMSTLGNYLFQSFNFRSKSKLKPFYGLVANITAEELGHVELVSNGVALLNNGPGAPDDVEADISNAPFADMKDIRLAASFLSNAGGAMPMPGLAMGLGGVGVTLNDLVALYAGLARLGTTVPRMERAASGEEAPMARRLLDPVAAWYVGNVLLDTPPPENAAGGRIAFKTGTSYGYRDAWAVGFDGQAHDRCLGWPSRWRAGARPPRARSRGADPV
jgi:Manganese containing catalase